MKRINNILAIVSTVLGTALAMLLPASCDVYDDLDPCTRGLNLRFVYDYNMEFANAFPAKVDCYTLYVYDKKGSLVKTFTESGEKLKDENYRLTIDLPLGDYQIVAYGGTACEKASFAPVKKPEYGSKRSDLKMAMKQVDLVSEAQLHDFYYGAMDVTVKDEFYKDTTLNLMCNTNNIRIMLQHMNGTAIPMDKFSFSIEDDNTLFDVENNLIPNGRMLYLPWAMGEATTRGVDENNDEFSAGYAEFSTSRLMTNAENRLTVRRLEDNEVVLSIPLSQYLMLLKSDRYANMGGQEFLDREGDWSMVFFLDSRYKWIDTQIIINGWVVRLNDLGL